ncbi:PEP-utilizing enzyme [Kribbella orskensis]|uniref:PEP-utilizing enzyme n=1 Tax=Kribbella TaxID=182639 RepID=UPI00104D43D7
MALPADRLIRVPRFHGPTASNPTNAGLTGPVHLVHGPDDFADGNVLVARATAPAWTPHSRTLVPWSPAAGTVASLVAREHGIPAVVGTRIAIQRLHTGQLTAVDRTTGAVIVHTGAGGPTGGRNSTWPAP